MLNDKLSEWVEAAHSIAWDECHKIYILMDATQTEKMRGYGYPHVLTKDYPVDFSNTIVGWFEDSCDLRFIAAVSTNAEGLEEFHSVVEQFESVEV